MDAVFCCVGTTQKKAGSTEAFQKVDRDIPIALARWAAANGAATFVGISSVDANAPRESVYLRTKGEMESGVAGAGGARRPISCGHRCSPASATSSASPSASATGRSPWSAR